LAKFAAKLEGSEFGPRHSPAVVKSLISIPAKFIDALPDNNDDFSFDYEPDLEAVRDRERALALIEVLTDDPESLSSIISDAVSKQYKKDNPLGFRKRIEKVTAAMNFDAATADAPHPFDDDTPWSAVDDAPWVIPQEVHAKILSGRIRVNPSVEGQKVAFTTGLYYSDLKKNINQVKNILTHYEPKIKDSGYLVKFPAFSGPLNIEREKKALDEWLGIVDEILHLNSAEFTKKAPKEENTPTEAKNNPDKSWLEFGWNQYFEPIYILFNGHPLRIGFNLLKHREPFSLARTNAFIHRSPEIAKEFGTQAGKKEPWTEWIKKNVYPAALIEPTNEPDALSDKAKRDLAEARKKANSSSAKTTEEIREEDSNIENPELEKASALEAKKAEIDATDQTLSGWQDRLKKVKKLDEIYDFIFNKLPFESIAMEFLRCIGGDLTADGVIELLVRLAIKEIFAGKCPEDMLPEECAEYARHAATEGLDDVMEILFVTKDCALDILDSGWVIEAEEISVDDEALFDPDMENLEFEAVEATGGTNPSNEEGKGITHIVRTPPDLKEPYSNPVGADKKQATFWKTLPWEASPGSKATGYTPSGGTAHGRLNPGAAIVFVEAVATPGMKDDGYYEGSTAPPDLGNIFASGYLKVRLYDPVANLPAGTIGYIHGDALEELDDAAAAGVAAANQAVILKKGSRDGKNGLTNEVKALQSYMGAEVEVEDPDDMSPANFVAGKTSSRKMILAMNDEQLATKLAKNAGAANVQKLLEIEITNLDGIFEKRMKALTRILGLAMLKAHIAAEGDTTGDKRPLIDKASATKMATNGVVTVAAMAEIKVVYKTRISGALSQGSLEDIKNFLSFRTPSVVLGNVLFAPPGFYDGKETQCNDSFVALVGMQAEYEAALIAFGSSARKTKKTKLQLEALFDQYKVCMGAIGTNVYGNYVSHLFGRDISVEEQKEKDGYKIIFGDEEKSECHSLEVALKAKLGGDIWPGAASATAQQQKAFDNWMACVHATATKEAAKQKEKQKQQLKDGIVQMHVSARANIPKTFAEVYDLFVNQNFGMGAITGLTLKEGAGLAISDAIFMPGRPCQETIEILLEMLLAYILEKYPEIELTVRYTMLAYKKSMELYALVRSKIDGGWESFGLPNFGKLSNFGTASDISKKMWEALEKVLYEVLFLTLRDLSQALAEICALMNESAASEVSPPIVAADLRDALDRDDAAQIAQSLFANAGIIIAPGDSTRYGHEMVPGTEWYTELTSRPTIHAFLLSVIDGLSKADVCSIIRRSHNKSLTKSVRQTLIATYPEHVAILNKESTILAIFDMIAEIMPADYCDNVFAPSDQTGFLCLADVIEHNQKERLSSYDLPDGDVAELIAARKKRNMDRMVQVADIIANPARAIENAMPNMCGEVKKQLMTDPGFISSLQTSVNAQLQTVRNVFNIDLSTFKPILLQNRPTSPLDDETEAQLTSNPFKLLIPEEPAGSAAPGTPIGNFNIDLFMEDSAAALSALIEGAKAKAGDEKSDYEKTIETLGEDMGTKEYFGLFSETRSAFLTWAQLIKLHRAAKKGNDGNVESPAVPKPDGDGEEAPGININTLIDFVNDPAADGGISWPPDEFTGTHGFFSSLDDPKLGLHNPVVFNDAIFGTGGYNPLTGLLFRNFDTANGNAPFATLSDELRENFMEFLGFEGQGLSWPHTDLQALNDNITYPSNHVKIDYKEFLAPFQLSDYSRKLEDDVARSLSSLIMANLKNALANTDDLLQRPNATTSPVGAPFQFSLKTLAKSSNALFANTQYSLIDVNFPSTKQKIDNSLNIGVVGGEPVMQLTEPIMLFDPETNLPYPNPAAFSAGGPQVEIVSGEKIIYSPPTARPLYAENFIDLVGSFVPITSKETGQSRAFLGLVLHAIHKHFPLDPSGGLAPDWLGYLQGHFDEQPIRGVYMSMVNTVFENTLKAIGKSKYFLQDEISKLNLNPDLPDLSACADDIPGELGDLSLLGLESMRSYMLEAFEADFNPCEVNNKDGSPETLESVVAEICVILHIRATILEMALSGIFAFGTFNVNDITNDHFIKTYLFNKLKTSLEQDGQYKAFKETAIKVLERKRKQKKKIIPLMAGNEALIYLIGQEAKVVSPIYEELLGSRSKNFGDVMLDDIIFPIPVDMHDFSDDGAHVPPYSRLTTPFGEVLSSGLGASKVKKYYGIPASLPDKEDIKVDINGVSYTSGDLGKLSHAHIFGRKPGFILERFLKLEKGHNFGTLVDKFAAINDTYTLPGGPLPTPPDGPSINMDAFFKWVNHVDDVAAGNSLGGDDKEFLNSLLYSPWDEYYNISFGVRVKYLFPTYPTSGQYGRSYFADVSLQAFSQKLEEFIGTYEGTSASSIAGVPPFANDGAWAPLDKSSRVSFISKASISQLVKPVNQYDASDVFVTEEAVTPGPSLTDGTICEIPMVEEFVTAKTSMLPSGGYVISLKALSDLVTATGTAADYYDMFVLNHLKTKIKNNNMFKSIFEYMIPSRSIINTCSAYVRELVDIEYPTKTMFTSTKYVLALLHGTAINKNLNIAGSTAEVGVEIDDELSLEDKIHKIILGYILKALLTAPLLIIKGVAEAADPNIMLTKKIFDAADLTVKVAMSFIVDAFEMARQEYMVVAKDVNKEFKEMQAELGNEVLPDELPMPEYNNVREFQAFAIGINPPLDPSVGIPRAVAWGIAPPIAISMMPCLLPFGVGFPPPFMFGPGVGPPMTMFAPLYLAFGLIKEGGVLEGLMPDALERGTRDVCGAITRRKDPHVEDDDDPNLLDTILDPTNVPPGPLDMDNMKDYPGQPD